MLWCGAALVALVALGVLVLRNWYDNDPNTAAMRVVDRLDVEPDGQRLGRIDDPFESAIFVAVAPGSNPGRVTGFDALAQDEVVHLASPLHAVGTVAVDGARGGACDLLLQERSPDEYERMRGDEEALGGELDAPPDGFVVHQITARC
jgi:hypothetical protein